MDNILSVPKNYNQCNNYYKWDIHIFIKKESSGDNIIPFIIVNFSSYLCFSVIKNKYGKKDINKNVKMEIIFKK